MNVDKEQLFGTLLQGKIEIRSLVPEKHLEDALELINSSFCRKESICTGTEINLDHPESVQARKELVQLSREIVKDGVSLVAVCDGNVVGVCFNKLQSPPNPGELSFFAKFDQEHCKSPNAKALMNYMMTMDEQVDPFDIYGIDCLMELVFLSMNENYQGKGIARALCKYSIDLARDLRNNVKIENVGDDVKIKQPKAVAAIFTSIYSQKIGIALGFKILNEVPFTKYTFNGKTFGERIGSLHTTGQQVLLLL